MAGIDLKPSDELVAASFAIATVVAIFGNYTAPVNDVKANTPNHQTANDTRRAAIVSAAVVSGVALLTRSPNIFMLGAGAILVETWVRHHANYTMPKTSA